MDTTPNLDLPYIAAAQAQKHVTHNEAIRALDAVVQLAVRDRDRTDPPPEPHDGDRHIVGPSANGTWTGRTGQVAAFQDGTWRFFAPATGWIAWVADEGRLVGWDGTAWIAVALQTVNPVPLVGINAIADATNRLSLNAPAALFNHAGAGHQLKINKAAAGDTASLLFQTGFSGRAELGLTGGDDYRLKVSPDGQTWHDALVVEARSGRVTLPLGAIRLRDPSTPASASAPGAQGEIRWDGAYLYVCIATDTWARAALEAGPWTSA